MTWRDHAACLGMDEMFAQTMLPGKRNGHTIAERKAVAMCATCPVRRPCLDEELQLMREGTPSIGVFGGTTGADRRRILREENGGRPPRPKRVTYPQNLYADARPLLALIESATWGDDERTSA